MLIMTVNLSRARVKSRFNSLPNDKFLDWSKLKAFADDKTNMAEKLICLAKGRKHCWKRRKCCLPAFSPFPTMFSKAFFFRVVKSRDCVVKSFFHALPQYIRSESGHIIKVNRFYLNPEVA